jgi:hypothetical protein
VPTNAADYNVVFLFIIEWTKTHLPLLPRFLFLQTGSIMRMPPGTPRKNRVQSDSDPNETLFNTEAILELGIRASANPHGVIRWLDDLVRVVIPEGKLSKSQVEGNLFRLARL